MMSSEIQQHAEQAYRNECRIMEWRRRWLNSGQPLADVRAHIAQRELGIDWKERDERGRLKLGPDGYLPRNRPGEKR